MSAWVGTQEEINEAIREYKESYALSGMEILEIRYSEYYKG